MDLTDFPAFRYDFPNERGFTFHCPGSRRWFLISRPVAALANLATFA